MAHDLHELLEAAEEEALDAADAAEAGRKTVAVLQTQLDAAERRYKIALERAVQLRDEVNRLRTLAKRHRP